jgi:hypothetical protein
MKYLENDRKVNVDLCGELFEALIKKRMELDNKMIEDVKNKIIKSGALNRQFSNITVEEFDDTFTSDISG